MSQQSKFGATHALHYTTSLLQEVLVLLFVVEEVAVDSNINLSISQYWFRGLGQMHLFVLALCYSGALVAPGPCQRPPVIKLYDRLYLLQNINITLSLIVFLTTV